MQRGHGLGSLVKGLFRSATPLLKKGAIALGKEALSTGLNIMEDTLSGQTLKNATKKNVSRAGKRLMNKSLKGIKKRKQVGGSRVFVLKRKRQRKKRFYSQDPGFNDEHLAAEGISRHDINPSFTWEAIMPDGTESDADATFIGGEGYNPQPVISDDSNDSDSDVTYIDEGGLSQG